MGARDRERLEEEAKKEGEEGQRHGYVGTTATSLEVRQTGETGIGEKRHGYVETWGHCGGKRQEETGRGCENKGKRGSNFFGGKGDRCIWKWRIEGQRHGDVGTTTIALDEKRLKVEGRWTTWSCGENSNYFGGQRNRRLEEKRKDGNVKKSRDTETTVNGGN